MLQNSEKSSNIANIVGKITSFDRKKVFKTLINKGNNHSKRILRFLQCDVGATQTVIYQKT